MARERITSVRASQAFRRRLGVALGSGAIAAALGFGAPPHPRESPDVLVLEDFEDDDVGALPRAWKWRGWGRVDEKPYRVEREDGNRFLRGEARGENVMLYRELRWDVETHPYFSWRWRIRSVPEGGDERLEDRADSAAGIYLMYRRKLGLVPETVKFVWSSALRRGDALRRPGVGMPWTVVAGAGAPDGSWHRVVYHVADVYERTFGGELGERPRGFGLLSDANNTGGVAAADYDDFVALGSARDVERVERVLSLPR